MKDQKQMILFGENPEQAISDAPNFSDVRFDYINDEVVYSVIDSVASLMNTDYKTAQKYWSVLKSRLLSEGSQVASNCSTLKMKASDGKKYATDVMTREQVFRLIQSIPSPNVETWKMWLAKQGENALIRQENPEQAISDAMDTVDFHIDKYQKQGKSNQWIEARITGIVDRKRFTQALHDAVINADSYFYAQATDKVYRGLWDRTTSQLRGELQITPKQNPRDHFGTYALIYTRLTEMVCSDRLEQMDTVSMEIASNIIWDVATMIRGQAQATQKMLGHDLVTNKPLLHE